MFTPPKHQSGIPQLGLVSELLSHFLSGRLVVHRTSHVSPLPLGEGDVLLCARRRALWLGALVLVRHQTAIPLVARVIGLTGDQCASGVTPSDSICVRDGEQGPLGHKIVPSKQLGGVGIAIWTGRRLQDLRFKLKRRASRRQRLREWWYDLRHRADTRGFIRADVFGFSPSRVRAYVGTPWELAQTVFERVGVSAHDVFVDYGCGKGRMLLIARRYPFRRIVGVELIPELAAVARSNARSNDRIEVVEADASRWDLPVDATVLYAFNPFGSDVWVEVLQRIGESQLRTPRRVRLITYGVDPTMLIPLLRQDPHPLAGGSCNLYEIEPGDVVGAAT